MSQTCVVGALACQKDSYLRHLDTQVVSCEKSPEPQKTSGKKSKSTTQADTVPQELWQVEFADSVLFPEGGGQPWDYGTVLPLKNSDSLPIEVRQIKRHGLRCIAYSPKPLDPGTKVRQEVDFSRRWDHMQQHTGQHLLSAVMDKLDGLPTVGWAMGSGDKPNYVDLPRKPSEEEIREIENTCNMHIRENVPITVTTPDDAKLDKMPEGYATDEGVVRVINIGELDSNPCCGTHLRQTSHIGLILLLFTQSVHGKNCRLFFTCGDRAAKMAAKSINAVASIAKHFGTASDPEDVVSATTKTKDSLADYKKRETKLLQEIATFEGERVKASLLAGKDVLVYRAEGQDFITMVLREIKEAIDKSESAVVVLASGKENTAGQLVVSGPKERVESTVSKIRDAGVDMKGGGKPGHWQGKVIEWKKGEVEVLKQLFAGQ